METVASSEVFFFEEFRLDRRGGLSHRDDSGAYVPVAVGSRGLDILRVLVARAGEVVSKDEIIAAVWPGTVVEDSNLTVQISALRRVLDRDRPQGSCIQTVPGRGYRFVAPVTGAAAEAPKAAAPMPDATVDLPASRTPVATPRRRHFVGMSGAAAITAVVILAISGWWLWPIKSTPAPGSIAATSLPQPSVVPRLSIVVLPFANLSNDPDQQYFADGLSDDLTTDLSRIPEMLVISRNTAFTYRSKPVDTRQIGRELGVRYVLEGSIQRSGQQLRVNAQLINAETGAHLWAERFDREISDLFDVQNEIAGRIANTLSVELIAREAAQPRNNPDALEYILRGRAARLKANSPEAYAEAIGLFERALALDPQSIEAQSRLAGNLTFRVLDSMADNARADLARAEALIDPVLVASPRYAYAHFVKGQVLRAQRRFKEAALEFQTVLASDPNDTDALHALSFCKLMTGSIEEVIPIEERVIRLSPRDPKIGFKYARIGVVHLLQSHIDEAIFWLQKALRAEPKFKTIHSSLASAYALKGETERAAAELAKARQLSHDDRYSSIARLRAVGAGFWGVPKIQALYEATFLAGLRKAGMPEK